MLTLIAGCVIFVAIFTSGVYLQIKVISVVKRDQTIAWEINLAHSVAMVVIFSSVLILKTMTYYQITFYDVFGKWLCYLLLSVMIFGFLEMLFHSLYISLYKYIFIVYREAVNRTGEQKTKRLLLWAYFILLTSWTLSYLIRPNFDAFEHVIGCRDAHGPGINNRTSIQRKTESSARLFSCDIENLDPKNMGNVVVNILTKVACTSQALITYALASNVLEIFFYLRIFGHMNRHVGPRNSEYLGLSDELQRQNSRNIRVNAQVTAVITMLEFLGGCVFMIGRVCRMPIAFGSLAGVTLTMILYFVVLPYAFLMNTRYNKNRILEEGWINVLKNMVLPYKCNAVAPDENPTDASHGAEKINKAQTKSAVPNIFLISSSRQSSVSEKIDDNTFTNFMAEEGREYDDEMQKPTCSYSWEDSIYNENDFVYKDKSAKANTSIDSMRENMISDLLSYINNEEIYIKKLTHFVDIEEAYQCGKDIDTMNYDYEQLNLVTLPHFVGSTQRKSDRRTTELQKLFDCRKENDIYRTCFDHFVDMEENFVENGC